jgi:hypothetical protein
MLIVSITVAPYVNKGSGKPFFSDELRMQSLVTLSCVEFDILNIRDHFTEDEHFVFYHDKEDLINKVEHYR